MERFYEEFNMKWPYVPTKNASTKRKKESGVSSEETVSSHDSPVNNETSSQQERLSPSSEETLRNKRTKIETCHMLTTHAASMVNPERAKQDYLHPNISPNYDSKPLTTNQGYATHVQPTERLPSIAALQHMHENDM